MTHHFDDDRAVTHLPEAAGETDAPERRLLATAAYSTEPPPAPIAAIVRRGRRRRHLRRTLPLAAAAAVLVAGGGWAIGSGVPDSGSAPGNTVRTATVPALKLTESTHVAVGRGDGPPAWRATVDMWAAPRTAAEVAEQQRWLDRGFGNTTDGDAWHPSIGAARFIMKLNWTGSHGTEMISTYVEPGLAKPAAKQPWYEMRGLGTNVTVRSGGKTFDLAAAGVGPQVRDVAVKWSDGSVSRPRVVSVPGTTVRWFAQAGPAGALPKAVTLHDTHGTAHTVDWCTITKCLPKRK